MRWPQGHSIPLGSRRSLHRGEQNNTGPLLNPSRHFSLRLARSNTKARYGWWMPDEPDGCPARSLRLHPVPGLLPLGPLLQGISARSPKVLFPTIFFPTNLVSLRLVAETSLDGFDALARALGNLIGNCVATVVIAS